MDIQAAWKFIAEVIDRTEGRRLPVVANSILGGGRPRLCPLFANSFADVPVLISRSNWRRWSVPRFTRRMARRHPELERQILWPDVGQDLRAGVRPAASRADQATTHGSSGSASMLASSCARRHDEYAASVLAMHELCRFRPDDPGEAVLLRRLPQPGPAGGVRGSSHGTSLHRADRGCVNHEEPSHCPGGAPGLRAGWPWRRMEMTTHA